MMHHLANVVFNAATWRAMHGLPPLLAALIAAGIAIWLLTRRR